MPTTLAPLILAICPATLPVAPAAPETTTVSPGRGSPICVMPYHAVTPVSPSAESMSCGCRRPGYCDAGSKVPSRRMAYCVQPGAA